MPGIYIHIPFCASRCIYCDFYSTTQSHYIEKYIEALIHEIQLRKHEISNSSSPIKTIYIGGGTPSQLPPQTLLKFIDELQKQIDISEIEEFTLEANPEDLTSDYISVIAKTPINRISMGVQSFIDQELKLLHRRHDSIRPTEAIADLRKFGINNISIDLMYGLPAQTLSSWEESINRAINLKVNHVSAYCLSVEEKTKLHHLIKEGKLTIADEETCLKMATLLKKQLGKVGYEQYEISNYAFPGFHSIHNSSYWTGDPYWGFGPGAHSYDGTRTRSWNDQNIISYIKGDNIRQTESLTDIDLYNEKIMLSLRTIEGLRTNRLNNVFQSIPKLQNHFFNKLADLEKQGWIIIESQQPKLDCSDIKIRLSERGFSMADEVIRQLFYLPDD